MLKIFQHRQSGALAERKLIVLDVMLSVLVKVFTPNQDAAIAVLGLVLRATYDLMVVGIQYCKADRLDLNSISLAGCVVGGVSKYADDQKNKNGHRGSD